MNFNPRRAFQNALYAALAATVLTVGAVPAVSQERDPKRTPAPVMSYRGAPWLERETREQEEKPHEVIKAVGFKTGDVVADLGVGSGYYARKIAKIVGPEGKVYGVDIQQEMLDLLVQNCDREGIANVVPVLGDYDDPHLPKGRMDWIFMSDVYHEFSDPEAMLAKMLEALKPGGRVALLEYRLEDDSAAHIKIDHRMSVKQVLSEWNPAGFELIDLLEFLPSQHLFIFHKRPKRD